VDIEITIGKGRGYVPAEDNKPKDAVFGYIPTMRYLHRLKTCGILLRTPA